MEGLLKNDVSELAPGFPRIPRIPPDARGSGVSRRALGPTFHTRRGSGKWVKSMEGLSNIDVSELAQQIPRISRQQACPGTYLPHAPGVRKVGEIDGRVVKY